MIDVGVEHVASRHRAAVAAAGTVPPLIISRMSEMPFAAQRNASARTISAVALLRCATRSPADAAVVVVARDREVEHMSVGIIPVDDVAL